MPKQRFVIVGRRRDNSHPWLYYITHNGCLTSRGDKACPVTGIGEAKAELEYWNRTHTAYEFSVERLPPRLPLKTAILKAVPIEV